MGDWRAFTAVAFGGGAGAVLRYVLGFAVMQRAGPGFPWGTFVINVTGSLIIGLIAELSQTRAFGISPLVRVFLMVGVLGGYTTFSSFELDTLTLVTDRAMTLAFFYAFGSLLCGLIACFAGFALGRALQA